MSLSPTGGKGHGRRISPHQQVAGYRDRAHAARDLADLVAIGRALYSDERQGGSMSVLTQLMAGAAGHPQLSRTVTENFERWIALVEVALDNALGDHPLGELLPRRQVAVGISAMFLGMELMNHGGLEDADPDAIFDALNTVAELVESLRAVPDFLVRCQPEAWRRTARVVRPPCFWKRGRNSPECGPQWPADTT